MAEVVLAPTKLVVVQSLQAGTDGAAVLFKDGVSSLLPNSDRGYAACLELLEDSLRQQRPVGVSFARDGNIEAVRWADRDCVKWFVGEHEDAITLCFRAHAGLYRLRHDHPDFQRIYAILKRSEEQGEAIWFVHGSFPLTLLDIFPAPSPAATPPQPNGATG